MAAHMRDVLAGAPTNWGRWGPSDELGALNFLTQAEVLRAKGLRLTWDEQTARASVEKAHRPGRRDRAATGVDYLARKRDMLEVNRARLAEAQAAASGLYRDLSAHASEARRRTSTERQSVSWSAPAWHAASAQALPAWAASLAVPQRW